MPAPRQERPGHGSRFRRPWGHPAERDCLPADFSAASAWKGKLAILGLGCVAAGLAFGPQPAALKKVGAGFKPAPTQRQARLIELFGKLPLSFEANRGQADSQVQFLSRGPGYTLFLTGTEAVLSFSTPQRPQSTQRAPSSSLSAPPASSAVSLRMSLVGANPHPKITPLEELPGKSNYFLGNDPTKWRTNVPHYARVRYESVYPGIDLVFYGNHGHLEFDFVVAPGADPNAIHLDLGGTGRFTLGAEGDLIWATGRSHIRMHKPLVYQETKQGRSEIPSQYAINDNQRVSFEIAAYDARRPLFIDPVLSYSTYLGGTNYEASTGIAVDLSGNVYLTGETDSRDFPGASSSSPPGSSNVFVVKLNANASAPVYSLYLGGSSHDQPAAIAVDSSGNAYVTGSTTSADFPTVNAAQKTNATCVGPSNSACGFTAFLAKISATGAALEYSTYWGGELSDGGAAIRVDSSGNAYVTGRTLSRNFPTTEGSFQRAFGGIADAFVAKFGPAGNVVLSTYLGGSQFDGGAGVAVDLSGNLYVTGETMSSDFPLLNPAQAFLNGGNASSTGPDAFVAKLNPSGSALLYSTFLGGSRIDQARAAAVDSAGNAYVTGSTNSSDFPLTDPLERTPKGGFVAKLNAAGSALIYSTYLAAGSSIALDSSGNLVAGGRDRIPGSEVAEVPMVNALQGFAGGTDGFVARLNSSGSAVLFSTYLGGAGLDDISGVAVDRTGNIYVTGSTRSADFPRMEALQIFLSGEQDAFVAKISETRETNPRPTLLWLSPSTELTRRSGFSLAVNGGNFFSSSVVRWNGAERSTIFQNSSLLRASIPNSDLVSAGTARVTVFTPGPGGGASNALDFIISSAPAGAVNAASYGTQAVAPGSIVSLFGANLATSTASAQNVPLPANLAGTSLQVNGISAPLFYVSPQQINFQLPWQLSSQTEATFTVFVNGVATNAGTIRLSSFGPGIFALNQQGTGQGAVLIAGTGTIAGPTAMLANARPVRRGEFVSIFCTGFGPVTNPPASGAPALAQPLSATSTNPSVTIGGMAARVTFSGLAPGFVGLYQVNAEVPLNALLGNTVQVVLTIGGLVSNTVTIAVE